MAGVIEVVIDGQRAPVRRARVTLYPNSPGDEEAVYADADAKYRFSAVKPGGYRLRVDKPGLLTAREDVELAPDQSRTVNLVMTRGGALEGRFADERGDPIRRISVYAARVPPRTAADAAPDDEDEAEAITDDLGRFRLHTLPPGEYVVHAQPSPPAPTDIVFFPGTTNRREARTLAVAAGQTVTGVDFVVFDDRQSPAAPEPPLPGGDDGRPTPTKIGGVVVRSDTGRPAAYANVMLASAATGRLMTARADSLGRFVFVNMPPADYVLTASGVGLAAIDLMMPRSFPSSVPVELKAGQLRDDIKITVTPLGAIEGRVVDEFGDPVPGATLTLLQRAFDGRASRLLPRVEDSRGTGPTDDLGRFRFYDLPDGEFYLVVVPAPFRSPGVFPPEIVRAGGFAVTYLPGTDQESGAQPITISRGADVVNVLLPVQSAALGTITGRVVNTDGTHPEKAAIVLAGLTSNGPNPMALVDGLASVSGTFAFRNIPDGTYALQATADGQFGTVFSTIADGRPGDDIRLELRPTIAARGVVRFEGGRPTPEATEQFAFMVTNMSGLPMNYRGQAGRVNPSDRFEIPGLSMVGLFVMRRSPRGWALKSVKAGGTDITERPYDFRSADVNDLEVVLTSRVGSVKGTVSHDGGPAIGARVIVFTEDASKWSIFSRGIVAERAMEAGAFVFNDLLPGRYLTLAVPPFVGSPDPRWLAARRAQATPVTVVDGRATTVDLKLLLK